MVGEDHYPSIGDVEMLVIMGSVKSLAGDLDPVTRTEVDFVSDAVSQGTAVLGICFGSQMLARILGGRVEVSPSPEIGWYGIETNTPAEVPGGPWFQWHYDRFEVPPGAVEIARNANAPQAFRLGRLLAVQFHPEATPDIVDLWLRVGPDVTEKGFDPEVIRADTERYFPQSRRYVDELVEAYLESIG